MRLLLLATALISILSAQVILESEVSKHVFANGFLDGTLITFYFKHIGNGSYPEPVRINFYDLPGVEKDNVYDIAAHLRIERHKTYPVYSNSYENYKWLKETNDRQVLDEVPPSDGWWRVDVYRHDNYNLSVFFQGFWSGIRTFNKYLNGVRSVYVMKDFVDHSSMQINIKNPSNYVPSLSVDQFKANLESTRYNTTVSFPHFSEWSNIEMIAMLRATGGKNPALVFVPSNGGVDFSLTIKQQCYGDRQRTYIGDGKNLTLCAEDRPNGDLQHLRIERMNENIVDMHLFYKPSAGKEEVVCRHTFSDEYAAYLDQPFVIASRDGAIILYLDHSIPRTIEVSPDR